jgi:Family of unknown function (DUF5996)
MSQWPPLPFAAWEETCNTLHMWTQIVGKTRLALSPPENHCWHTALYVTPRGLTTSAMPHPVGSFDVNFDFLQHELVFRISDGRIRKLPLRAKPVSEFYREYREMLQSLDVHPHLWGMPVEVSDAIPFAQDTVHHSYNRQAVQRFFEILVRVDQLLKRYRSGFIGKQSPVNFWWGSFDIAVSRFSGRRAPERPEADSFTREAYSHEVMSCGFWPGNGGFGDPAFYAYIAPEPPGLLLEELRPSAAYYSQDLHEFLLLYDDVIHSSDPEDMIMTFFECVYRDASRVARWPHGLEREQSEAKKAV